MAFLRRTYEANIEHPFIRVCSCSFANMSEHQANMFALFDLFALAGRACAPASSARRNDRARHGPLLVPEALALGEHQDPQMLLPLRKPSWHGAACQVE